MRKSFIPVLTASVSLLLAACGGDNKDDQFITLPPENKTPGQSGDVQITERTYEIELQAPTPAWSVKIDSVYVVGDEIPVVCTLTENKEGMVAQVITEISDSVTLKLPDISPQYYVIGPKIGPEMPGVTFVDSFDAIPIDFSIGEKVWPKE